MYTIFSSIELLHLEQLEDGMHARLLKPLKIIFPDNLVLTVPEGFKTDFASVPRILWWWLPPSGSYARAAVAHDYLYHVGAVSRFRADQFFLQIMKMLKVGLIKRQLMYWAVRVGGWRMWNHYRRIENVD